MSEINIDGYGYTERECELNWAAEYTAIEIERLRDEIETENAISAEENAAGFATVEKRIQKLEEAKTAFDRGVSVGGLDFYYLTQAVAFLFSRVPKEELPIFKEDVPL